MAHVKGHNFRALVIVSELLAARQKMHVLLLKQAINTGCKKVSTYILRSRILSLCCFSGKQLHSNSRIQSATESKKAGGSHDNWLLQQYLPGPCTTIFPCFGIHSTGVVHTHTHPGSCQGTSLKRSVSAVGAIGAIRTLKLGYCTSSLEQITLL